MSSSSNGSPRPGTPLPRQLQTHFTPAADSPHTSSTPSPTRSIVRRRVVSLASSLDKPFRKVVRFVESPTRGRRMVELSLNDDADVQQRSSAAATLPPHILEQIFLLLAKDSSQLAHYCKWSWVVVTHVCRQWRSVAMDCPDLWSWITNFRSLEQTRMFLTLSRSSSLTIRYRDVDSYFVCDPLNLDLVFDHFPRIRDLEIDAILDNKTMSPWYLGTPNLWLKRLSLSVPPHILRNKKSSTPLPRSAWFLNVPIKDLQSLSLSGYHCDWSAPLFENLVDLSISCIPEDHHRPDITELLDILRCCPKLESLKLDAAGPEELHTDPGPPVYLPHLRTLELLGIDTGACAKLMSLLIFPENVRWAISCKTHKHWLPVVIIPQMIKTMAACEHLYVIVAERTLRISAKYLTNADIEAGVTSADECGVATLTFNWDENLHLLVPGFDPFTALSTVIGETFWRTARGMTFYLYTGTELTEAAWTTTLHAAPSLSSLEVILPAPNATLRYSVTCESLISALTPRSTQEDYRCAGLALLKIHNANFSDEGVLLKKLKNCLKNRLRYGMMIRKLSFVKAYGKNKARIQECSTCVDELLRYDDDR